jgi:hypothetical protein
MSQPAQQTDGEKPGERPTYRGFVANPWDAIAIMEAAVQPFGPPDVGYGPRLREVQRRFNESERKEFTKSGTIVVYREEHGAKIKRWTDSLIWSPSRVLGQFLIYRECEPIPDGQRRKPLSAEERALRAIPKDWTPAQRQLYAELVGSLNDTFDFKVGGLVKKTLSVKLHHDKIHLTCYYCPEDVMSGALQPLRQDAALSSVLPHPYFFFPEPGQDSFKEERQILREACETDIRYQTSLAISPLWRAVDQALQFARAQPRVPVNIPDYSFQGLPFNQPNDNFFFSQPIIPHAHSSEGQPCHPQADVLNSFQSHGQPHYNGSQQTYSLPDEQHSQQDQGRPHGDGTQQDQGWEAGLHQGQGWGSPPSWLNPTYASNDLATVGQVLQSFAPQDDQSTNEGQNEDEKTKREFGDASNFFDFDGGDAEPPEDSPGSSSSYTPSPL